MTLRHWNATRWQDGRQPLSTTALAEFQMQQSALCIDDQTLTHIFKCAPRQFQQFSASTQQAPFSMGVLDPPKNEYPLFEHLILWLYGRWIGANISKTSMFGPKLSTAQKTNLGEAIDYLLYSNFLPLNAELSHRVSLLSLCYHDKFGFRDDPVLLQRMWYIRAYVLLEDDPDGAGPGERWKWFDHRLALVIYSWVRHNRKYHGCPKVQCHCRQMIDLYGVSIGTFKSLYMALEKACVSQLQFIRSNEPVWLPSPGSTSLSRADDIKLYFKPQRKTWPHCFAGYVTEPDPLSPPPIPPIQRMQPVNLTVTSSRPVSQAKPQLQGLSEAGGSSLPPPHPSLPARPGGYVISIATDPRAGMKSLLPAPAYGVKWPGLPDPPPPYQPVEPPTQPPPPKESPPPPPPHMQSTSDTPSLPHQTQTLGHSINGSMDANLRPGPTARGVKSGISQFFPAGPSPFTAVGAPMVPPSSSQSIPTSSPRSSTVSKDFVTAPSTPNIPTTTPTAAPVSPAKRGLPTLAPWPSTGPGGSPQAIPSAPRSMREVKGTSSGPIPTGPRALSGVAKAVPNVTWGPVYIGVPSAPRSMRGSLLVGSAGDAGGNQRKENHATDSKGGVDDAMSVDTEPSPVPLSQTPAGPPVANNRIEATRSETTGENKGPISPSIKHSFPPILAISKPGPFAPRTVPPTTGKRSRSDTKADEILAKAEMDLKAKTTGSLVSKQMELVTPENADQPAGHLPPSLPPAKRVKILTEPESPTRGVNKTFMTRKSVAKDGVAILAAVSKQKGGKPVPQDMEHARKEAEFQDAVKELKKINTEMKSHLLKSPAWAGLESTAQDAEKRNANTTAFVSVMAGAQKTSPPGNLSSVPPSEKAKVASASPASSHPIISTGSTSIASIAGASRSVAPSNSPSVQQAPDTSALDTELGSTRHVQKLLQNAGKEAKAQPTTSRLPSNKSTAPRLSTPQQSGVQNAMEMVTETANAEETSVSNPVREKFTRNAKAQGSLPVSAEPQMQTATVATRKTARAAGVKRTNGRATTPLNDEILDRGQQDREGPGHNTDTTAEVEIAADPSSPVELASPIKKGRGKLTTTAAAEARPKRKVAQKGKPESTASQVRVNPNQLAGKFSKKGSVAKDEIIDLSSDESVTNAETRKDAMEFDERKEPSPILGKSKAANTPISKPSNAALPGLPAVSVIEILDVVEALQSGPPFPTVLVRAADPEKRMQTPQHEARRLVCALIAVGVPMDWWMVGVTDNGFILRDEAAPLIMPLLTEATIRQLSAIGITILITPAELLSDSEEEQTPISSEFELKTLSSKLENDESLPLVIFDGLSERRLRSQDAEEKRLRKLMDGLLGRPILDAIVEMNAVDNLGSEEALCLVCPTTVPSPLNADQISRLGKVGLAVYRGDTQLAGPLPLSSHSHSRSHSNSDTFDWRAMRTEVMKMKLPWEMTRDSLTPPSSVLYSPSTQSHSSSFTEPESSPADTHFRHLLRPNLWSGSGTFSRMASAGMRWGEFNGVDPDSTDESGDEEEAEEPRLGAAIHA